MAGKPSVRAWRCKGCGRDTVSAARHRELGSPDELGVVSNRDAGTCTNCVGTIPTRPVSKKVVYCIRCDRPSVTRARWRDLGEPEGQAVLNHSWVPVCIDCTGKPGRRRSDWTRPDEAYEMHEELGRSAAEIARIMKITLGTAEHYIREGRRRAAEREAS